MSEFDPNAFFDLCYAAALDTELWPQVLDDFGRAVGARGSLIVSHDPSRTAHTVHSLCLEEVGEDYSKTWWQHDSRIARAKSLGLKPGTIYVDAAFFSPDEKLHDPFFQDFFNKHGLDDMAAYFSTDPLGSGIATISAPRNSAKGPFDRGDISLLRQLAPHVTRAFHLAASFRATCQHASDLAEGLEKLEVGTIVLDNEGRVQHLNEVAERLIAGYFRVYLKRQIRALIPEQDRMLADLIAAAMSFHGKKDRSSSLFRRVVDGRHLHIEAVPLKVSEMSLAMLHSRKGGVLLLVRDAFVSNFRSIVPHLQQLGLTLAEAHAAMLVGRGLSPRAAADQISISEQTIRVQLRTAFLKLNINRQSQLSTLVARLDNLMNGS